MCILLLSAVFAQAQTTATTSGGEATGSGGSVSYSVGQVVYTTNTGINGSVAQGVQQPYEISDVTGIEEATGITLLVSAYPNPTTDFLNLKVDASATLSTQVMQYQLYDMQGRLLKSEKLQGTETQIQMSNYRHATYFVRVISENKTIKEFKVIKN
jgi:hypothetical protein